MMKTRQIPRWCLPGLLALLLGGLLAPGRAEATKISLMRVGSEHYVALTDMARFYGLTYRQLSGRSMVIESPWSSMAFQAGTRRAEVNGVEVWLHAPLQKVSGNWAITQTDMSTFIDPVLRTYAHLANQNDRVVVLDPGHGGHDPGAVSRRGLQEKDMALDIAQRVRAVLAQRGLPVLMTRDTDKFLPLRERCAFAERNGADLFVSIHLNGAFSREANGLETYVLTAPGYPSVQSAPEERVQRVTYNGNGHDGANTYLAYAVQKSMLKETGRADRGLRHARFAVLKGAPCPATLVECGFLSNLREESMLRSPSHRDNLARGIARGVLEYLDAVKRARVVARNEENPFAASQWLTIRRP